MKLHKIQAILTHFWFRWKILTEKQQFGVIGCKKLYEREVFSKKKYAEKGVYCQVDGIYRPMGVFPPPALDLMKFIPI